MLIYNYNLPFITELGDVINGLEIGYTTYGNLNAKGDNVIWICHALTANSEASNWWPGMIGSGKCFDTDSYFIVCANVLGSCYGTTGPLSINPDSGEQWLHDFPEITIRDIVRVNDILREHLKISHINTAIGGSIGGFQSMEWALMKPDLFDKIVLIACSAKASPWVIAFNESQRMALMADESFSKGYQNRNDKSFKADETNGMAGLKAARSIALLSYRTSDAYNQTQAESSDEKTGNFNASSYQQYQGEKLIRRFNAYSYYVLTRFIDSHNIYRGRPNIEMMLNSIKAKTLVIGITTDILYPVEEQRHLASVFPQACYREIYSDYGHDGFLIESEQLTRILSEFQHQPVVESSINLDFHYIYVITKPEFMKSYLRTMVNPLNSFERLLSNERYFVMGFIYILIPIIAYTLMYIFLTIAHGAPSTFTPWLNIPKEEYYSVNRYLLAPSMIISWWVSTSFIHIVSRSVNGKGSFEQTLSVIALSISIAMWGALIHDLPMSFLSATGFINAREHEIAMNTPTIFRTLLWISYSIYFIAFLLLFPIAVRVVHKISWAKSAVIGLIGFVLFQLIFLIFNR